MKKLLCIAFVIMTGMIVKAQDQVFSFGASIGFPTQSNGDSDVVFTIEANYLFEISESFLLGPSVSYIKFLGKKTKYIFEEEVRESRLADVSFYPIAIANRYNVSEKFVLGVDLGYGIGVNSYGHINDEGLDDEDVSYQGESGIYYRVLVGFNIVDKLMLQAAYSTVNVEVGAFSNLGIGVMFSI